MTRNTRAMIRDFSLAFGRPVNESWTDLTVEERVLLGKLLLEEALEYCFKGLGLQLYAKDMVGYETSHFMLSPRTGASVDPVECADGLADVNVVAHFNAHWHGFNLDEATEIVNDSNMSKLGADGKPIINGVTPGYMCATEVARQWFRDHPDEQEAHIGTTPDSGFDPDKPIGKILKGPNFYEPGPALSRLIMTEGNNRG